MMACALFLPLKVILADGTVLEGHFECGEITNLALSNASFSTGIDEPT